jgi:hypothetical protein
MSDAIFMQASRGRIVNLSPSGRSDLVRELAISRHIWNHSWR